ncbi:MAG: amidase family protein [Sulfitobacter sp.]
MNKPSPWSVQSAPARLQAAKARLAADAPDTRHIYTQTFADTAPADGAAPTPLSGALVSIKDLFDVAGYVTRAGTRFMANDAPAAQDADVVAQLRAAGAVLTGHTNMTELAYSGLGLNPHYGTPENAFYPGCIPGGSTSGGAVAVALGLADIAIGTDTGGSLRIPAAFNGITGFKPSQANVSRRGSKALSRSLDSVGPMARSVADCRAAYHVIARPDRQDSAPITPEFIVPENFGMDDLDPAVAAGFTAALAALRAAGFNISHRALDTLDQMKSLPAWQFSAIESRGEYDAQFQAHFDQIDPRVSSRMARAEEATALGYRQTLNQRDALIEGITDELAGRVLLMPTVPILPPRMEALQDDAEYGRVNLQALRNPTIANVMDGCSISLPYRHGGDTIGVMLIAQGGSDAALLDLAEACETALSA